MAEISDEKAYIGIEREEKSLKYIAKVAGEPKREISRLQYNAIVKALGEQDWRNNGQNEASVVNRIIGDVLLADD